MPYDTAVMATLFLICIATFFLIIFKSEKVPKNRLKIIGIIAGLLCVFLSILSLNMVLFVIAPRVCGELKDGMFGAAGGILLGASMFGTTAGAILVGLSIKKESVD